MSKASGFLFFSLLLSLLFGYGTEPSWIFEAVRGRLPEEALQIILNIRAPRVASVFFFRNGAFSGWRYLSRNF